MRRGGPAPAIAVTLCAISAIALGSAPASAFERQHHVGVSTGLAMLRVADKGSTSVGLGVVGHYAYGLNDALNLVVEGGWAKIALREDVTKDTPTRNRPTDLWHAGAGLTYTLDKLRWVPYFGGLATVYDVTGGSLPAAKPVIGAQLAVGLDYQISPTWTVGAAIRQHFLLGAFTNYPSYTNVFARVEYVWGW